MPAHDPQHPVQDVTIGGVPVGLPFAYHANDVFQSLHTAAYDAVAGLLPSEVIRPVRWLDGSAVVAVTAFRYRDVSWARTDGTTGRLAPYGEISVAAVVTRGPVRRGLPLLARRLEGFVLHLPVTTAQARDGGREFWGYPKFVADMDFAESPTERRVVLSEAGARILSLTVRPGGPVLPERRPLVSYTSLGGALLETVIPVRGHAQSRVGSRTGELVLGEHAVADGLRRLRMSSPPIAVSSFLDHRSVLPAGRPVGPAQPYEGFRGADRAFGRFTVRYPGTPPIDQYAASTPTGVVDLTAAERVHR